MKKYLFIISSCLVFLYLCDSTFAQDSFSTTDVKLMMINGNYKTAVETINVLLNTDSTNYDLLVNLGLAYQGLFQYDKAKVVFYKAYELKKFDIPLLLALGRNYKYMGASNYAALFFEQAYVLDSTDLNILLDLSNAYLESYEFEKAKKIFYDLFDADTTNSYLCKQLAYCNYKLGDSDEAIKLYTKAQDLNEYDATIPIQLGNLLVRREEYETAYYVVRKGLRENGSNMHLNRLAAEILFKMKKYFSAQLQYESLINVGDSTAVYYQRLGFCYYMTATDTVQSNDSTKIERITKAVSAFKKGVELDDEDALGYMYLGLSYKVLDSLEISNEILSKSIEKMVPDYIAVAYSSMANNYELIGDYENAIKAFRKAGEYAPSNTNIIFQLATLYDKYYDDKNVPLMYYKKYLREAESKDERIAEYINERIEHLNEYLHFRK